MQTIQDKNLKISTIISFALIPLTGFATDVYLPSLPSMASELHVSSSAVQLSIVLFMISGGVSQLFVGTLLDSFGRRRLGLLSMLVFALASFAEGIPVVLMEAMAMEIPCVATRIAGIPELIEDGVEGLLVAASDVQGMAAAIGRGTTTPTSNL